MRSVQAVPPLVERNTWPPPNADELTQIVPLAAPGTTMSLMNAGSR